MSEIPDEADIPEPAEDSYAPEPDQGESQDSGVTP